MVAVVHHGKYGATFQFKNINNDVIPYMVKTFNGIYHNISKVEYTLDFHTSDNGELYSFISSTMKLKYRTSKFTPADAYETTRYTGDPRKTKTMASRAYLKEDKEGCPVRIEAILGNNKLKEKGIRTIEKAVTVSPSIPFERSQFKRFDHKKFLRNTLVEPAFEREFFAAMNSSVECGGFTQAINYASKFKNSLSYYIDDHLFNDYFNILTNKPMFETIYGPAV